MFIILSVPRSTKKFTAHQCSTTHLINQPSPALHRFKPAVPSPRLSNPFRHQCDGSSRRHATA